MAGFDSGATGTILADGGIGTEIRRRASAELCEAINLTDPAIVRAVHGDYLRAGARLLTTNSFCAQPHFLARFGYGERTAEINTAAVEIAFQAIREAGFHQTEITIAGSIGPGDFPRSATDEQVRHEYRQQVSALCRPGLDLLLVESCRHMATLRAALEAISEQSAAPPCTLSVAPTPEGRLPNDISMTELLQIAHEYRIALIGLNCGAGPRSLFPLLGQLRDQYAGPVWFRPSAGLPTMEKGGPVWPIGPTQFAEEMAEAIARFTPAVVGGCCGTGPAHIAALRRIMTS